MFDTLVESGSHSDDLARKGSFFLGTMVLYSIVLVAVAVLSVYLYNDSIPDPSLELLTLVAPAPMEQEEQVKPKEEPKPTKTEQAVVTRTEISVIAPVTRNQEVASEKTKEVARDMSKFINKGTEDSGVSTSAPRVDVGFKEGSAREGSGGGPAVGDAGEAPPPPPAPTPKPDPPKKTIVSGGVLNGKAISKPQPAYPPIAKAARASGTVTVQIVVDESGRVISASAVSGHPLLQQAAVSAARNARFSPTLLSGQPVKVSGVITYNFVLQ
ncbi:MAG TPA: TonB family protein [Pyrinomonadaceae bacterium]|jgi:protein TonB|nr:TonB family protein [Pyrinomonadaceae bacterium]